MMDVIRNQASSWGIKILFGLIIIVFVFWGIGSFTGPKETVVAYVGDSPILSVDLERQYKQSLDLYRSQNPGATLDDAQLAQYKEQVLANLIKNVLLTNEADKLGLTASTNEIKADILAAPAFLNEAGKFDFDRYEYILRAQGLTPTDFENEIRNMIKTGKINEYITAAAAPSEAEARSMFNFVNEQVQIDYILFPAADYLDKVSPTETEIADYYMDNSAQFKEPAKVTVRMIEFTPRALAGKQTVSDEEAKAFYEANKEDFKRAEEIHARHILLRVAPDADNATIKAAQDKLGTILAKIKMGKSFEEMAKEYGEDGTAKNGGDLDWFGRGMMVAPFEEAAFALEPGQVSEPVRTQFGWHLIKVDDKHPEGYRDLAEVKERISAVIAEEKAADQVGEILDEATEQAAAGVKLDDIAKSFDLTITESDPFSVADAQMGMGMSQEDLATVFDLKPGQATELPVAVTDGYILAEKIENIPASLKPLADVKGSIKTTLKNKLAGEEAKRVATDALKELADPAKKDEALAKYKSKIVTTKPFGRRGPIPDLGQANALIQAAYDDKTDAWLAEPYNVAGGWVAARVDERVPPAPEAWETQKQIWVQSIGETVQTEMANAFMQELMAKANVRVTPSDPLR